MPNLSSLDDHLVGKIRHILSPRARTRLAAVDTAQRRAAHEAQQDPRDEFYYRDADHDCFAPGQVAAAGAFGPAPAPAGRAAETFESRQRASWAALERLRGHSRSLAEFVREVGALQAPLSRRYAYVPAAQHGIDLWAAAATPAAADASPRRASIEAVSAARAAIEELLDGASPGADGLAEARERLNALAWPSLQLARLDPRQCPPPAPTRSGRGRAAPPPPAQGRPDKKVRRTLTEVFEAGGRCDADAQSVSRPLLGEDAPLPLSHSATGGSGVARSRRACGGPGITPRRSGAAARRERSSPPRPPS